MPRPAARRVSVAPLRVGYSTESAAALLARADTLALFEFGGAASGDARHVSVPLAPLGPASLRECWSVDAPVRTGRDGTVRWSAGGGWRLAVIELDAAGPQGIEAASDVAYEQLLAHVAGVPECHLQRIWNYLDDINAGTGDAERYRLFCAGRGRSLRTRGLREYPAATAIGHHGPRGLLQVYALCSIEPGQAIENPRQVSAWRYPRRYGKVSPRFARAMRMPDGMLAISGTAAVVGHASHHPGDLAAQVDEAFANLDALLARDGLPAFDGGSPLKVYVRNPADAAAVSAALTRHLDPAVPRVLLRGDICRSELLVEIDGWHGAA